MSSSYDWHTKKVQIWIWEGATLKRRVFSLEDFGRLEEYCTSRATNVSIHYLARLATSEEIERLRARVQDVLRKAGNEACEVKVYRLDEGV